MQKRSIEPLLVADLKKKMVFLGGPRQVGKTTLAKELEPHFKKMVYFNWDRAGHKKAILREEWPEDTDLLILDEIHKYPKWKSMIKGVWDTRPKGMHILVTGSARLDTYRKGGDSLMGRYHYYRLHPFTLAETAPGRKPLPEYSATPPDLSFPKIDKVGLKRLLECGGFPEPFLDNNPREVGRWQSDRSERLFREDIRTAENIRDLASLELMAELMPERVGSPLSFASLSEDCHVSPKTIAAWVELLSRNYYLFRVLPFARRMERALTKESKYYLWNWREIEDDGPRFENLVASHLLKYCHFWRDVHGIDLELCYLRDREKREVDFLLTWRKKPWLLAETSTKLRTEKNSTLAYFGDRLGVDKRFQILREDGVDTFDKKCSVHMLSASAFLSALT